MIENFFQSLERNGVDYLLISGQAAVLYGAATFSEDIDLWIKPTGSNRDRFLLTLHQCGARFYMLTPALTVDHLQRGHGFHFILPGESAERIFLDVMGRPPRAGSFEAAATVACRMDTEWGAILTIGIRALVELKKTQRLEDYPIISRLALAWFEQPASARIDDDFLWALRNIFTLPELTVFFTQHPAAVGVAEDAFNRDIAEYGRQLLAGGEPDEFVYRRVSEWFQSQISALQLADRHYWRDIIRELKELRAAGTLMAEGEIVPRTI